MHTDAAPVVRWHPTADRAAFVTEVCDRILTSAACAILAHGVFRVVLAGGDTPRAIYARLAGAAADWAHWRVYFGDERCLPVADPGRNDTMVRESWLAQSPIAPRHVFAIPAEFGADDGARRYAAELAGVGDFDLVLLGLGADGHTASLFPGGVIGDEPGAADVLAVHAAPKPPAERVSLSAARLSRAHQVFFLVSGPDKHAALIDWQRGAAIPASRIQPAGGVDVFLDQFAAPQPDQPRMRRPAHRRP